MHKNLKIYNHCVAQYSVNLQATVFNWFILVYFSPLFFRCYSAHITVHSHTHTQSLTILLVYSVGGYLGHNNNIMILRETLSAVMNHYYAQTYYSVTALKRRTPP